MKRWLVSLLVIASFLVVLSGCVSLFKEYPFVEGTWIGKLEAELANDFATMKMVMMEPIQFTITSQSGGRFEGDFLPNGGFFSLKNDKTVKGTVKPDGTLQMTIKHDNRTIKLSGEVEDDYMSGTYEDYYGDELDVEGTWYADRIESVM